MLTEDYVSFEIAKLLKEKGFDKVDCQNSPHFAYNRDGQFSGPSWDTEYNAPTLQMAMKWLREKHLLHISIDMVNGGRWEYEIDDISCPFDGGILPKCYCEKSFSSYEEACEVAIKYTLENLI